MKISLDWCKYICLSYVCVVYTYCCVYMYTYVYMSIQIGLIYTILM